MTSDTTALDPAMVEVAARAVAELEPYEPWPTNSALGGNLTGTRDDEYRDACTEQAKDWLRAVLPSLRAQVAAEVLGPVLALADDLAARAKKAGDDGWRETVLLETAGHLRALVPDPDAVTRHEAGLKAAAWDEGWYVAAACAEAISGPNSALGDPQDYEGNDLNPYRTDEVQS